MVNQAPIRAGETLIVFDEIQECNAALNTLKYFCENAPQHHVACAGSLLGIALSRPASFPVGKVEFLPVSPMTFTEFLLANGDGNLADYLGALDRIEPIPEPFFNPLVEKLKMYFITGGMPEAVAAWTGRRDVGLVQMVLRNILSVYELDFARHGETVNMAKLNWIWSSIPAQLSRENKKFLFRVVREGARAREYEDALVWLSQAGLVHRVFRIQRPGLPLSAYDDLSAFKLYTVDVGLLRRLALLDPVAFREGSRLFTEFKGALTENFVLQGLVRQFEAAPRYWASGGQAEVDFVVQRGNDVFPVEVKSNQDVASRSLAEYAKAYPRDTRLRVRLSLQNLKMEGDLLNVPLFLIDHLDRLIRLGLECGKGEREPST